MSLKVDVNGPESRREWIRKVKSNFRADQNIRLAKDQEQTLTHTGNCVFLCLPALCHVDIPAGSME